MSFPTVATPVALAIARLGLDAAEGKIASPADVARSLLGLGLELVPRDDLARYLTEMGITAAETAADIAESAKFDKLSDPLDEDELP